MTLLLIVLLVLLLAGGGYGYNSGYLGANPLGIVLLVVLILLLFGLIGGASHRLVVKGVQTATRRN